VVESKPGGPPVVEEELIEFCREHLASYKKPTRVIEVEALPRTASGKAQKFVLVEEFGEVESAPAEAPGG
jgi:fatty-acyl-CoA synthase